MAKFLKKWLNAIQRNNRSKDMSAKCTPGPWALNLPCTDEIVADIGGNDISVAKSIRNPADAALLVVARELLATLKQAVARQGFSTDELISARALIAKADGAS